MACSEGLKLDAKPLLHAVAYLCTVLVDGAHYILSMPSDMLLDPDNRWIVLIVWLHRKNGLPDYRRMKSQRQKQ